MMGLVQEAVGQYFADAELTHDDLDSVLGAVRTHFGEPVEIVDPALQGRHTYLSPEDRFVVTLAASYSETNGVTSLEEALRAALDITRGVGSGGVCWWAHDRATGRGRPLEQAAATEGVMP